MFKKLYFKLAWVTTLFGLLLSINCCSLVGYKIGSVLEEKKNTKASYFAGNIKSGTQIKVYLRDGSCIRGEYEGLSKVSRPDYVKTYSKIRRQKPAGPLLPAIGDTLDIKSNRKTFRNNEFLGFDYQYRKKFLPPGEKKGSECFYLSVKSCDDNQPQKFYLNDISKIDFRNGKSINKKAIRKLVLRGEIPLMTTVDCLTFSGAQNIAMENIDHFELPVKKNVKGTYFAYGLGIDFIIFMILFLNTDMSFGPMAIDM
jgi:hypothetical protein